MKKIVFVAGSLIFSTFLFAQAPQKMTYQAVVRETNNDVVSNGTIGLKVSIIQSNPNGMIVYTETHQPTTNTNGLFSVQIGNGTVQNGTFATINWATDDFFLKTEIDPTGGTNYSITNTSQFLSVPYAFHSKTATMAQTAQVAESLSSTFTITETDPVFDASVAKGITVQDTIKWNRKSNIYEGVSTSQIMVNTFNYTSIPGASVSVNNLKAGQKIFVYADGGVQSLGSGVDYSIVVTGIAVNNNYVSEKMITLANTGSGGVGQIVSSFTNSTYYIVPSNGNYTFSLGVKNDSQSVAAFNIGGTSSLMRSSIRVIVVD